MNHEPTIGTFCRNRKTGDLEVYMGAEKGFYRVVGLPDGKLSSGAEFDIDDVNKLYVYSHPTGAAQ